MKRPVWSLPDGVEDLLPPQAWELERIRRKVLDIFRSWGFDYIEPPLIEYLDALLVAGGRDLDLQTLKAVDQRSGRLLGVRADMTSQAARIDASRLGNAEDVARLCYAGPMAHANPQGVLESRVPIKAGAEIFGSPALEADAEVVALMLEVLDTVGFKRRNRRRHLCPIQYCPKIFLGTRSGWDGHVGSLNKHPEWHPEITDKAKRRALFRAEHPEWSGWIEDPAPKAGKHRCPIANCTAIFQKNGRGGRESKDPAPVVVLGNMGIYRALTRPLGLDEASEHSLFAAVQSKSESDIRALTGTGGLADLLVALPKLMGHIKDLEGACLELAGAPVEVDSELARLRRLVELLRDRCPDAELRFDLAELAGFGYHNGPVFAAFHGDHGQALARGGRYDGIGATFGRARPATGFDLNLKRLLNSAPVDDQPIVWVPWVEGERAKALGEQARRLRREGWRVLSALGAKDPKPAGCAAHFAWRHDRWHLIKTE